MLDLVSDVIFATFAIAETATVLFSFEIAGRFNFRIVLVFLTAKALVDQMDEDTLCEIAESHHAVQVGVHSSDSLTETSRELL